jgi:glyoxylase-like metal-dependent hydrolase (beta-lactamase superfamily II)
MAQLLTDEGIFREKITPILPEVYQFTYRTSNVFLIIEEKITLIDTGFRSTAPRVLAFLGRMGYKPEAVDQIILTHSHPDHIGGLSEFKRLTGARTACHQADISEIDQSPPVPRRWQKTLESRPMRPIRARLCLTPEQVDIPLQGGEEMPVLGGLKVIHTPGHTPGSICLFSPTKKLIFVGDAITNRNQELYFARRSMSSDIAQAAKSVRLVKDLDFNIMCFGHHQPVHENARKKMNELISRYDRE